MAVNLKRLIGRMTLAQKVGQCFTLGFVGGLVSPEVIRKIIDFQCGGIRITPSVFVKYKRYKKVEEDTSRHKKSEADPLVPLSPCLSPRAHLENLNELQKMAVSRPCGIPLHVAIDNEGGQAADVVRGGYPLYPAAMGQASTRDEKLIYQCWRAIAELNRASGVTNVHSPVLDINVDPRNPEVNCRAFGDTPAKVARYAAAACRGLAAGGLIATGKHFPGRGDSHQDAHYELPTSHKSRKELFRGELYPYIQLVKQGLMPSIMLAHQVVPALGDAKYPATVSPAIVQGLMRNQLGYEGVITTDSLTMEGLLKFYSSEEASARGIAAGVDLILHKSEDLEEVEDALVMTRDFVKKGIIPEQQLDDSVMRILKMKEGLGLFQTKGYCDPDVLEERLAAPKYRTLAKKAAGRATLLMRDRKRWLPLDPKARVLVVEQGMFQAKFCNDEHFHAYMLWEFVRRYVPSANLHRLEFFGTDEDLREVAKMAKDYDVVIASSYYSRGAMSNARFLCKLAKRLKGKPMPVVSGTPYALSAPKELDCAVCVYSDNPLALQTAADVLFGKQKAGRTWPVKSDAR